jgi:hypothetical protein
MLPQAAAIVFGVQTQVPGLPLQDVCGAAQLPQVIVPPQPSATVPQVLLPQAWARVFGVQTQVPGLPLQDVCGAVQLPQVTVPPHPFEAVPQVLLPQAWAAVRGVQQVPAAPASAEQVLPGEHVPQVITPPQPSDAVPQLLLPQAWACVAGMHWQVPLVLPSARTHVAAEPEQVPQLSVPPQPSGAVPQLLVPQACGIVSRTHASGAWQARLISANTKNVFALLRQSWSPHSRPTWLRVQVSFTWFSSFSVVPGQDTVMLVSVPVHEVLPSFVVASTVIVYGPPTGMPGIVVSMSRTLRAAIVPDVLKLLGPVSV